MVSSQAESCPGQHFVPRPGSPEYTALVALQANYRRQPPPPDRRAQLMAWLRTRRGSIGWFFPLFALTAVVQLVNMSGSPQRTGEEGAYTAQAFAIDYSGQLAHHSYGYHHPPLGPVQIAVWTRLTDAFARYDSAVLAGREAMVVAHLAAIVLLWMLARRLKLSRPAAAAAVAIYALSPLAVQFHRTVFGDNVATPWLLAAFVLVFAPRRQLVAFAAAAVCFSIAVLSQPTYLLFLPFLAWQMWRLADRGARRYTLSVAAAIFVLMGGTYVLSAVIHGELFPAGLGSQLGGRTSSGSLFEAGSQARVAIGQWLRLDPVLAAAAPVAALLSLRDRRLWPVASALLFLIVFMLRPGYLPSGYVIAMMPFAALVIPAAVELFIHRARTRSSPMRQRVQTVTAVLVAVLIAAVAAPLWAVQLRGLLLDDEDQPMRQAETWVEQNVDRDHRLAIDGSIWVDLVLAGFPRDNLVWYGQLDTDRAVAARTPTGWRTYDYVVSTSSMRTFPGESPTIARALDNSLTVATFGGGDKSVTIFRVQQRGIKAARKHADRDRSARSAVGSDLVKNPALDLPVDVRNLLIDGRVDARIMIVLTRAATLGQLTVSAVPAVPGEEMNGQPRRQLLISQLDGLPMADSPTAAARLSKVFAEQPAPYAPRTIQRTRDGLLITYDVDAPTGLLPSPGEGP